MPLLALDTCLDACSVGILADDDAHPFILSEVIGRGHAERLMPMVEAAMARAGLAFRNLDRIVVTIGPGTFTGVRIGVAAARGLALVTACPVVGIGTLAVLAETARARVGARPVLAALDARRGQIYVQPFAADGVPLHPPRVGSAAEIAAFVHTEMMLAGSGAAAIAAALGAGAEARIVHNDAWPDVAALVRLAAIAPITGEPVRPLYLRPPDAKPQAGAVARR